MPNPSNKTLAQSAGILILHEQIKFRNPLRRILSLEGYKVFEAGSIEAAASIAVREDIELTICDIALAGAEGLPADLLAMPPLKEDDEDPRSVLGIITRALEKVRLQKRIRQLEQWLDPSPDFDNIVGESSIIREAIALAKQIAPAADAILLQGESGTGKELFARAIHAASPRSRNPFLSVNCNSFSPEALEWELFGYKAGAFPGAIRDKKGLLEEANKGSLMLHDIGDLDLNLQNKLLQALEREEFIRPGDTRPTRFNIRLFSANKKDLMQAMLEGKFREDLFYRLSIFTIKLPSLRDRKMDIPLLARRFMKYFARKSDIKVEGMSKDFLYHLQRYPWKGNISEMRNVMERAVMLAETGLLSEECLPFDIRYHPSEDAGPGSAFDLKNVERLHLQRVLNYTGGNKAEAAKLLNIGLTTLYRKMNEYSN
jgi:DNA-binding NtrC family response regulator